MFHVHQVFAERDCANFVLETNGTVQVSDVADEHGKRAANKGVRSV